MFVEAADGYYYKNPVVTGHKWTLRVVDEGLQLCRVGQVTWRTANHGLRKLGLWLAHDTVTTHEMRWGIAGEAVFDGELRRCSCFSVSLLRPIPFMGAWEARILPPVTADGEAVIGFRRYRGRLVPL
jgi:hypothetical protein